MNSGIDYDVRLRMIRRGDDPDAPRETRTKKGTFITVKKEETKKEKKSIDEVAQELADSSEF